MANLQVVHLTSGWVDCYSDGDFVATVHLLTEDFNIFSENSQRRFAIYQVRYKSININSYKFLDFVVPLVMCHCVCRCQRLPTPWLGPSTVRIWRVKSLPRTMSAIPTSFPSESSRPAWAGRTAATLVASKLLWFCSTTRCPTPCHFVLFRAISTSTNTQLPPLEIPKNLILLPKTCIFCSEFNKYFIIGTFLALKTTISIEYLAS